MLNRELYEKFLQRDTGKLPNIKDLIGQTVNPMSSFRSTYMVDGKEHIVLAITFDQGTYRTECGAFIQRWQDFLETIGAEVAPEDWPLIKIIEKKSKRGNAYIDFEIVME